MKTKIELLCALLLLVVALTGLNADPDEYSQEAVTEVDGIENNKDSTGENSVDNSYELRVAELAKRLDQFAEYMTEKEKDLLDDLLSKTCDEDEEEDKREKRSQCCITCKDSNCCGNRKCKCSWWGKRAKCKN